MKSNKKFSENLQELKKGLDLGNKSQGTNVLWNLIKTITETEPTEFVDKSNPSQQSAKSPTIGNLLSTQTGLAQQSLEHINMLGNRISPKVVSSTNAKLPDADTGNNARKKGKRVTRIVTENDSKPANNSSDNSGLSLPAISKRRKPN